MNDKYIAVIDSGVGGISLLLDLLRNTENQRYLYFGDNKNAPYGNKSVRKLKSLTIKNLTYLSTFNLKAVVIACNTLSLYMRKEIEDFLGVPAFGVFPPVESEIVKGGQVLLLSTCATARQYRSEKRLDVIGLKNLALIVENNAFSLNSVNIDCFGLPKNLKSHYDSVILGCTHYVFVKNQIFNHFCPQKVVSGNNYTVKNLNNFLSSGKSLVKYRQNQLFFIGENAKFNEDFFKKVVNNDDFK